MFVLAHNIYRIDDQFIIKVADFGLAEDVYTRGYFRQDKQSGPRLPIKWLAPESLRDGVFSEKSDVVINIVPLYFCNHAFCMYS